MFFYETRWRKWRILEDKEKVWGTEECTAVQVLQLNVQ
jgi:hypothetical protein